MQPFTFDAPLGMIEPLLIVTCFGIALLLLDLVLPHGKKHFSAWIALGGQSRHTPIPFGPYLAGAGWIALLWGDRLVGLYERMLF